MGNSDSYEQFMKRSLADFVALTPSQRGKLEQVGVSGFGEFLELEIDKCLFSAPMKEQLKGHQEELRKMAEKASLEEMAAEPMPPIEKRDITAVEERHGNKQSSESPPTLASTENAITLGWKWNPRQLAESDGQPETVSLPLESLLRHVFIAGGTGSGKTVLAKVILEEAATQGIPSLVIDPAGDLSQLWMQLPFDPDEQERVRLAEQQSSAHSQGAEPKLSLQKWAKTLDDHFRLQKLGGVNKETVARTQASAFVRLFAPRAGHLGMKLALPPFDPQVLTRLADEDEDDHHGRVALAAEELMNALGLTGEKANRIATVLIQLVVRHPNRFCTDDPLGALRAAFDRLSSLLPTIQGMPVNSYLEERLCLEFQRAVVTYQAGTGAPWLSGVPLDLEALMESESGCAPINVISIHHLSSLDQQRAVARIVSKVDHWMHTTQSQNQSVRALVYLDELGGGGGKLAFFPPVARPASKPPLMRLVRQARKYGVGVVFATQNMKDIDYQGLANINSWFVGKINNALETRYITDGIAGTTMSRGRIASHDLARNLPALPPGHFLHVDDQGMPFLMRGRYLSSLHCSPDFVPRVYDQWQKQHEAACTEAVQEFLSQQKQKRPSFRVRSSPAFVKQLLAHLEASVEKHANAPNALNALKWLIKAAPEGREAAESIVLQQTLHLPAEEATGWIDAFVDLDQSRDAFVSDLESRRLAIAVERGEKPALLMPSAKMIEPRRSWWQQLLDAARRWMLPSDELAQCRVHGESVVVRIGGRDIEQVTEISDVILQTADSVTEALSEQCSEIPFEQLLQWYRETVADLKEDDELPESETILQAMYASPLQATEHFDLASRIKRELSQMDPIEFEYYTADVLNWRGIHTEVTRASGDDGVDVFAMGPDGKKCAVQCKRYTKPVGPEAVRELSGSREYHQCDTALLVTTTSLTAAAEQTAESLGIDVIDGNHLAALHLERMSG